MNIEKVLRKPFFTELLQWLILKRKSGLWHASKLRLNEEEKNTDQVIIYSLTIFRSL